MCGITPEGVALPPAAMLSLPHYHFWESCGIPSNRGLSPILYGVITEPQIRKESLDSLNLMDGCYTCKIFNRRKQKVAAL